MKYVGEVPLGLSNDEVIEERSVGVGLDNQGFTRNTVTDYSCQEQGIVAGNIQHGEGGMHCALLSRGRLICVRLFSSMSTIKLWLVGDILMM